METKTNKFVEGLIEFFKESSNEEKALKIQKKADTLIKIAISNTENDILKAEEAIEYSEEALKKAIYNNGNTTFTEETDNDYVNNIITYKNDLNDKKASLEQVKTTLKYLKELQSTVNK